MNTKTIKTKTHYLLLDLDIEPQEGDYQLNNLTDKLSKRTDFKMEVSAQNCYKVIASLPIGDNEPIDGLPVMSEMSDDIFIQSLSDNHHKIEEKEYEFIADLENEKSIIINNIRQGKWKQMII